MQAPLAKGLHHVQLAIPTGGEEACRAFWGGVLGLGELVKPPVLAARGGCWFRGGRLEVHLGVEEPFSPARTVHPGILVDDLDATSAALVAAGHDVERDDAFPGFDRLYTADPFGNRLEFLQLVGPDLEIRFPEPSDHAGLLAAQAELLADGFSFAFDLPGAGFAAGGAEADGNQVAAMTTWCAALRAQADGDVAPGWVRSAFHVALLDGVVVGRVSTRFDLTPRLRQQGGHVGYGVRPGWRGRGVAHRLLRHGLDLVADETDLDHALVTCDDANRASAAVIEGAGGLLRDVAVVDGTRVRRYHVPLPRTAG